MNSPRTARNPQGARRYPSAPQGTWGADEVDERRPDDPPWRSRHAHRSLPVDVAEMLRRVRAERGWSFAKASRATGVSISALVHLEHARRRPSVELAEELAAGYRLDSRETAQLLAVALPNVGRSSPYRTGYVAETSR